MVYTSIVRPLTGSWSLAAKRELTFLGLVQNVAVVVAGAVLELLVVVVDAFADGVRSAEVERCALNFQNLSRRYAGVVDGQEEVGIELALNVHDVGCGVGITCQGEESVMSKVDDSLLVCRSTVFDY